MKELALLGRQLKHSFSPRYFREKFEKENIPGYEYGLMELPEIGLFPEALKARPGLIGLNVTIPYKEEVIPFLDRLDETAEAIHAVNTIRITPDGLTGYNTDVTGFRRALEEFLPAGFDGSALVLGTGGSSKAVRFVLEKRSIPYQMVSRRSSEENLDYEAIHGAMLREHRLIVNTTPLGMYPDTDACPAIPYDALGGDHYLFDLIYNPAETLFLQKGKRRGAFVKNGYRMLTGQAEAAWEIWTQK